MTTANGTLELRPQYSHITADLVTDINPSFLDTEVHKHYRSGANQVSVQVDAIFGAIPASKLPNERSRVILGQHAFMNRMIMETIPRSIMHKRRERMEDTMWGGSE